MAGLVEVISHVRVRVNEARQNGHVAEVYHFRVARYGESRADGSDFVALDDYHGVLDGLPAYGVEHARGAQREQGGAGLRRRVLRSRAGGEREKKKQREQTISETSEPHRSNPLELSSDHRDSAVAS